ncbi:MAG: glycosyltransferase family 39 protein [Ilumatobacteraceae bacterium]
MTLVLGAPKAVAEHELPSQPAKTGRFPIVAVVAAIALSVALRARFLTTPLTSDEGGYLAVARAWASGQRLYTDAWVDRPQGLLVLFRFWDDVTGGSGPAIRIMAIVFGGIAVAAVAYAAFALAGPRAAVVAGFLVAVTSANARIEGFIANGELLAGAVGAASVAIACAYLLRGRGMSWLYAAGVVAGLAVSIKQSGCDGFLAVMLCLAVGGFTREGRWRDVARECAVLLAGLLTVIVVLVVHGLVVGLGAWWYAVAGYRLEGINATSRADWHRFGITSRLAAPTILPLAAVAIIGVVIWLVRSRRITRSRVLVPAWVCFAIITFLAGGLFHRHYWVTLTFPLAAAASVAVTTIKSRTVVIVVACLTVIPSLISTMHVIVLDRSAATVLASDDPRSLTNERVADWFKQNRTPGSTIYAMCASAGMYAAADAISPYPYLWQDGVLNGRDAQDKLTQLFAGDQAPTFVVQFEKALSCNPGGRVDALLNERYRYLATVDGLTIYKLGTMESATATPR